MTRRYAGLIGASLVFHVIAVVFISLYATRYPLAIDEWVHAVPRAVAAIEGELRVADLVQPLNSIHVTFFTWLILIPNMVFNDWNLRFESLLNYPLALINLVLVLRLLTQRRPYLLAWLLLPISALMLAVQQNENLLVGFHNMYHFVSMFTLLAFLMLARGVPSLLNVGLAVLFGLCATFAFGNGLLVWPIGLLALPFLGYRGWKPYALWAVAATVIIALFLTRPDLGVVQGARAEDAEALFSFSKMPGYILFTLAYLGNVFTHGFESNILVAFALAIFGLVMTGVNAVALWRTDRDLVVVSMMLIAFSGGTGLLTAFGRLDMFGVRWGMATHYVSHGLLFWVGLFAMSAQAIRRNLPEPKQVPVIMANGLLATLCALFFLFATAMMFVQSQAQLTEVAQREQCMRAVALEAADVTDCPVNGGGASPDRIRTLYDYRLAGFAKDE